jgi:hypothetical protein
MLSALVNFDKRCSPAGHKIERPAAIIVFGHEAAARDNATASGDCAAGAFL